MVVKMLKLTNNKIQETIRKVPLINTIFNKSTNNLVTPKGTIIPIH